LILFVFSYDNMKTGFTVVLDMRRSKWDNVKPILKALQVSVQFIVTGEGWSKHGLSKSYFVSPRLSKALEVVQNWPTESI